MEILVINCGSSTVKADVLDSLTGERRVTVRVERIGDASTLKVDGEQRACAGFADHEAALAAALPHLVAGRTLAGVGHRVVHGGERFIDPTPIDDAVVAAIDALSALAPLHNPANAAGIRAARALLPDIPHFAVFDTAFHATLPRRARTYALPHELARKRGLRRYGFHGTSHAFVARRAAEHLGEDLRDLRVITCHLGNGASICAVEYGRSVETSMGMTPLEGLVMGTRCGDVDAGLLISLMRSEGLDTDGLDDLLNRRSGLAGLSGASNDMRDIEERAADGDPQAQLAIQVFSHRLRKYVGAYAAVMGGVDAIVFTGGIGQNSALVRHRVAQRLEFLGVHIDPDANREASVDHAAPVAIISKPHSRVRVMAVATDEELEIAQQAARRLEEAGAIEAPATIPVAISARHVHLTQEHVEALFGAGHQLQPRRELTQPGQYACKERVSLIGPKRRIDKVTVIGPTRSRTQVEIARTDEFFLGVDAPIRGSGDVDNTPGMILEGPAGRVTLTEGVICAQRHIHMTPSDAERFRVKHRDLVEVAIDSEGRDMVFRDVLVRVKESYKLEMHVDTDEGNAAELVPGGEGVIQLTGRVARLTRKKLA